MIGRVLFIPVSGPRGMGEFARALALGLAAKQRYPRLEIHFAVSRQAPYAADTPFPMTLLPSSPTFHSKEIGELIRSFRPTLVVFDNAGRVAQIRAAKRSGAQVVFISSRQRQRRKAFRLRCIRLLDEHWIAYPAFVAGALRPLERFKLWAFGRPTVKFLDVILPLSDASLVAAAMNEFALRREEYILVVPGGGTGHPGVLNAPQTVADAATRIAAHGILTVLVGVEADVSTNHPNLLRQVPRMSMAQLSQLIRGARLVISNGGDTLLQVLACAKPCIAIPIASDQAHRINECQRAGFVLGTPLEAAAITQSAIALFSNESLRAALIARLAADPLSNGLEYAVAAIERLSGHDADRAVGFSTG